MYLHSTCISTQYYYEEGEAGTSYGPGYLQTSSYVPPGYIVFEAGGSRQHHFGVSSL